MDWDTNTKQKLGLMIAKIPVFHRRITESIVTQKAQELAAARGAQQIEEEDVVSAFFSDVPSPFYSMMIRLLDETGFDYRKYGFPRENRTQE